MDDDGNDRNDPRAFAGGCIPVEIYKEHMANIREQGGNSILTILA